MCLKPLLVILYKCIRYKKKKNVDSYFLFTSTQIFIDLLQKIIINYTKFLNQKKNNNTKNLHK
jgi:hypothetical protein